MLGSDARVVETGGDRVRGMHLPVLVLKQVAQRAVQHARRPARATRNGVGVETLARGFDADQLDVRSRATNAWKIPIAFDPPPTHATTVAEAFPMRVEHLRSRFAADHRLKVAHHSRIRRGSDDGADDVVRVVDVRDPVANRLARRILQRARAATSRERPCAPISCMRKTFSACRAHVFLAHVHDALEPESRAHRRRRDAVLSRARLGDDPPLAHPQREQRLPDRVVDLVRAGVVQVFALEQDRALPTRSESRGASLSGDGRPT